MTDDQPHVSDLRRTLELRHALEIAGVSVTATPHLVAAVSRRAVRAGWLKRDIARVLGIA